MQIGDLLEWLGAAAIITAAALWSGLVLALALAGAFLAYEAQCYTGRVRMPRLRRRRSSNLEGQAIWRCIKCGGEHYLGLQAGHVCKG